MSSPVQVEKISLGGRTPWQVYLALQRLARPVLLESAMLDEKGWNRYSIVSANPFLTLSSRGDSLWKEEGGTRMRYYGDPFHELQAILHHHRIDNPTGFPFAGGGIGYLAYDLARRIEVVPQWTRDDLPFPEMYFSFYDGAVVHDHKTGGTYLVAGADRHAEWSAPIRRSLAGGRGPDIAPPRFDGKLCANFSHARYRKAVQTIRDYIRAGDVYQVNLTQRFAMGLAAPAGGAGLFQRLRAISPAPYAAVMDVDNMSIASVSPECFLRVRGRHIQTCPIKGTRSRGLTPEADRRLASRLVHSAKDAAELTMIVDLERNDLGKVCEPGTIRVHAHRELYSFSHVHHLVSTVAGKLRENISVTDVLKATLPGGSITGAPKLRAMEIIEELEPTRRGPYTGAIGYLSFSGEMELNIAIRTVLYADRRVYYQAGGAIVMDSDPEAEYLETLAKAQNFFELCGVTAHSLKASISHG